MDIDADRIEEPSRPSKEPDDAAVAPQRHAEERAVRHAVRAVHADVRDERQRPDDVGVAAERAVRPGDLLDDLRLAKIHLRA